MINKSHSKKIKKDYRHQKLLNPFSHGQTRNRERTLNFKWHLFFGFLVFIFLIWFFLFSSFWCLRKVTVSGLTHIPKKDITTMIWQQSSLKRWGIFKQNNIFLFNRSKVKKQIISKYNIAELSIAKVWPRTLRVKINERPYAFIFKEGTKLFYTTANGYIAQQLIIKPANQKSYLDQHKSYLVLENDTKSTLINNNKLDISLDYLSFVLKLNHVLSEHPDLVVEKFIIDSEFNTVKVKFIAGPLVYFNIKDSPVKQVNILVLAKRDEIKDNFKRTDYIDLRYGNRIFVYPEFK